MARAAAACRRRRRRPDPGGRRDTWHDSDGDSPCARDAPVEGLPRSHRSVLHVRSRGRLLRDGAQELAGGPLGTQRATLTLLAPPGTRADHLRSARGGRQWRAVRGTLCALWCVGVGHRVGAGPRRACHRACDQVLGQYPQGLRDQSQYRAFIPRECRTLRFPHDRNVYSRLRNRPPRNMAVQPAPCANQFCEGGPQRKSTRPGLTAVARATPTVHRLAIGLFCVIGLVTECLHAIRTRNQDIFTITYPQRHYLLHLLNRTQT